MRQKKLLTILLCIAVIFAYAACGGEDSDSSSDPSQTTSSADSGEEGSGASSASDEAGGSGKSSDRKDGQEYGELMEALMETDLHMGELTTGLVGDTMSNSFFDWKVNSVETAKNLHGKSAGSGKKFIVANITVTNTTDYEYDIYNADFIGYMEASEEGQLDTEWSFYDDMYPDEAALKAGKSRTGDLVFIVDSDVDEIVIDYIEFAENGSMGNTNWVDILL